MIWSDKDRFLGLETPSMASLAAPWPAQAMPAPAAVPGGPRRARRRREALRSVHPSQCCSSTSFQISDLARKFIVESTSSSTAQGGGGSFRNRKPIGEVGCCESRMAERSHWWTDRWLRSPLFLSLSLSLTIYLPTYLPIYLSIYLSASLKTKLFCDISSVFELDNIKNAAIQRDFLSFCTWQHQKRSNSARLPHFLHLTTSKTKQFGETSFKDGKLSAELTASHQSILRFFDSACLNHCACHEKVIRGDTKCCTCHAKTPQQTSAPGHPNITDEHVSCTAPATENASLQVLFKRPTPAIVFGNATKSLLTRCTIPCACHAKRHLNVQKWSELLVLLTFWLQNALRATTACTFSTSQLPKVVWSWCVLYILTWKCASHHNGVHFLDIAASPKLRCFVHFDLDMQFFISHLTSWLRTRRFSEPTFGPSGATNHWKNTVFRDFPTFSRTWKILSSETFSFLIFFLLLFSSLTLPISAFHLSILSVSKVWLLNFLRQWI